MKLGRCNLCYKEALIQTEERLECTIGQKHASVEIVQTIKNKLKDLQVQEYISVPFSKFDGGSLDQKILSIGLKKITNRRKLNLVLTSVFGLRSDENATTDYDTLAIHIPINNFYIFVYQKLSNFIQTIYIMFVYTYTHLSLF